MPEGSAAKRAFVSGVTGQDGAYLVRLLLSKGYKVAGGYRRTSAQTFWRLRELGVDTHENLTLVEHDLTDLGSNIRAIAAFEPDEIYNLAGQSFVAVSFKEPTTTAQISALGALQMLEASRIVNPRIRIYQASSAEMFGRVQAVPQDENTPFYPRSPYAVSKLFGHWSAINYRESYDMFVSSGILFNHESPLRGPEFVTRKISQAVARIASGLQTTLFLGNLDAKRDWGFAGDFVEGMWRMLQAEKPDTFVLATGTTSTVRDFATMAFAAADLDLEWRGEGDDEVGFCASMNRPLVRIQKALRRPAEVDLLLGSPRKAKEVLGWRPLVEVRELCRMMVHADLARETPNEIEVRDGLPNGHDATIKELFPLHP
ncbi:GDP-mannose 4,6-dehydratase [Consotaella salsifontis]|uniref:GDP-mannose 4,6-dehydratase n=1 Tax=Consotaella salsifontis TaxID=1365950 RepID=A0A1T4SYH5_9HYPH|nr:GDP-mannose 4,6-dehydratase [Consotaella salsifontis]SKA32961.1 GDPmannose 4,6-dehydratase [Consotaella salsifontis]